MLQSMPAPACSRLTGTRHPTATAGHRPSNCTQQQRRNTCSAARSALLTEQQLEDLGRQLYEVWSSDNLDQLDNIVAEDHAQQDEVWQPKPRQSREWLKTAISKFRGIFTDIRFNINSIKGHSEAQQVFVHWTSEGTFEGELSTNSGISLLTVGSEGKISKTQVYRQASKAEIAMAQRRSQAVPQAGLLQDQSNVAA